MSIIKIEPIGSCSGVHSSLQKINDIINENTNKKIYIIGSFLHNERIIENLQSQGCVFIPVNEAENVLNNLNSLESIIIFSAHGHSKKLENICSSRFISFYDLTCFNIEKNLTLVDFYKNKYPIIFVGKSNHEETEAFISRPNTYLYDIKSKMNYDLIKSNTVLVIPQTTISENDFDVAIKNIKNKFKDTIIFDGRCKQVSSRIDLIKKTNINGTVLVIGSNTSSNTKEIYNAAKSKTNKVYLINSKNDISFEIDANENYYLVSGCSALNETVNEIYNYIKEKQN